MGDAKLVGSYFVWKRGLIVSFVVFLLGTAQALACTCMFDGSPVEVQVEKAKKAATAVFLGEAIGYEWRKGIPSSYWDTLKEKGAEPVEYETKVVKFRVDRWWTMKMPSEVSMITSYTRTERGRIFPGCEFFFKLGETYLVYAHGPRGQLKTHYCARYLPVSKAAEDLKLLGTGKRPKQIK